MRVSAASWLRHQIDSQLLSGTRPKLAWLQFATALIILLNVSSVGFAQSLPEEVYLSIGNGDYEAALPEVKRLADKGNPEAQHILGQILWHTLEKPYDVLYEVASEAVSSYEQAAQQGYRPAQFTLGTIFFYGLGPVERDFEKAFSWLKQAADKGHKAAAGLLAEQYLNGWGVEADASAAKYWREFSLRNPRDDRPGLNAP